MNEDSISSVRCGGYLHDKISDCYIGGHETCSGSTEWRRVLVAEDTGDPGLRVTRHSETAE
jgi:hypothetical protein